MAKEWGQKMKTIVSKSTKVRGPGIQLDGEISLRMLKNLLFLKRFSRNDTESRILWPRRKLQNDAKERTKGPERRGRKGKKD